MQVESLTMPQNTETYTYNAIGALKLKQFKKGGTVLDSHDYGYNPDEMIQDVTRLGGVKVDYGYDNANQLTRITQTNAWKSEFVYDGLGRRRIQRDYSYLPASSSYLLTNEVRYVYDGMAVLQERDGNNAELVTYTRGLDLSGTMQGAGGIGGLLARTEHSATASLLASSSYYHSDAGGNITAMTDSSGNVVAKYLYDPFGNLLAKSGTMADVNRYRFSSKEVHLNSGSYYYGYRFYEPNLQRWLNEDPIREAGGMNLFGFVGNGPFSYVDSYGLAMVFVPPGWQGPPAPGDTLVWPPYGDGPITDQSMAFVEAATLADAGKGIYNLGKAGCKYVAGKFANRAVAEVAANLEKGQLVSKCVRQFMKGEKPLSQLSKEEIDAAIRGYQNAANTAKNAIQKAYQEARIKALRGEGPPPGTLADFTKNFQK